MEFITVPLVGFGITGLKKGSVILRWCAEEGRPVARGEQLLIIRDGENTFEVASPVSGILLMIIQPAGSQVAAEELIACISGADPASHQPAGALHEARSSMGRLAEEELESAGFFISRS